MNNIENGFGFACSYSGGVPTFNGINMETTVKKVAVDVVKEKSKKKWWYILYIVYSLYFIYSIRVYRDTTTGYGYLPAAVNFHEVSERFSVDNIHWLNHLSISLWI